MPTDLLLLTLYPNGLANLNGEAARHLLRAQAVGVRLLPPGSPEAPQWLLLPARDGQPLDAKLINRADRTRTVRLRLLPLAVALFACRPAGQPQLQLQLVPTDSAAYQLLPLD